MINFRFHIVSLTAVFLAFAVGLVLGTTFLDDATERALDRQIDNLDDQLRDAREDKARLQGELDRVAAEDQSLDQQLGERLVPGTLADVPILVIAPRGIDGALVERELDILELAGSDVRGVWWLTERLRLDDAAEVEDLATALEVATDDVQRLLLNLNAELASVLDQAADGESAGTGPVIGSSGDGAGDLAEPMRIARLHDESFIEYELPEDYEAPEGAEGDVVLLPASGLRTVVVTATGAEVPDDEVLLPTLTNLVSDGPAPVVVAGATPLDENGVEDFDEVNPLVAAIRDQDELSEALSTVDDVERVSGRLASVLALQGAGADPPVIGQYGLGEGADSLLPPLNP